MLAQVNMLVLGILLVEVQSIDSVVQFSRRERRQQMDLAAAGEMTRHAAKQGET